MKIKKFRYARIYWFKYFFIGDFINGEEVRKPVFAMCLSQSFVSYMKKQILKIKEHPFLEKGKFDKFEFTFTTEGESFGFGRAGKVFLPKGPQDAFVVTFEVDYFNAQNSTETETARMHYRNVFHTIVLLTKIGSAYFLQAAPNEKLPIALTQQLVISFLKEDSFNLLCHVGKEFHDFLRMPGAVYKTVEHRMKDVYQFLHPESPFQCYFSATTDEDTTGNLRLILPGPKQCLLSLAVDSRDEVGQLDCGYSLASANVELYPQFFALLAGISTLYKQFLSSHETILGLPLRPETI